METTVTTNAATLRGELAPLYRRFDGQTDCQPAYVEINPQQRTMTANWDAEIGNAQPEAVWHNLILRVTTSSYLIGEAVADLLDAAVPLAERICAGYTIDWVGHDRHGRLNDDAAHAWSELADLADSWADEDNCVSVAEAGNWLYSYDTEELRSMTDAEIDAEAERLVQEAHAEHVIIDGGADAIAQCLREWRNEA